MPRSGTGRVHARFADDNPLLGGDPDEQAELDDGPLEAIDAEHVEAVALIDEPAPPACEPVPPVVRVIERALAPIVESLLALSQYGPKYAPAIRVLSPPETADIRVEQVG